MDTDKTNNVSLEESSHNNAVSNDTGVGALIGTIIIIVVLLLGALYFWSQDERQLGQDTMSQSEVVMDEETNTPLAKPDPALSDSDSVESIENDLNSTTIEGTSQIEASI